VMGGKKEIYRDVWFFHGAIQLQKLMNSCEIFWRGGTFHYRQTLWFWCRSRSWSRSGIF